MDNTFVKKDDAAKQMYYYQWCERFTSILLLFGGFMNILYVLYINIIDTTGEIFSPVIGISFVVVAIANIYNTSKTMKRLNNTYSFERFTIKGAVILFFKRSK